MLDIAGLALSPFLLACGVEGEVGGGGGWGNRLHFTSKLGQLNLDSVLSTLTLC